MATHTMPCPLPGTFYRRSAPDQPPLKEVGDTVAAGDTVGLVEVMKTFTPIAADLTGKIAAFHVEHEDAVMAGQPLVDIET